MITNESDLSASHIKGSNDRQKDPSHNPAEGMDVPISATPFRQPITATELLKTTTLSAREAGIVELLLQGNRNEEIGHRLGITHGTVRNYLQVIYRKLRVRNRTELVLMLLSRQ